MADDTSCSERKKSAALTYSVSTRYKIVSFVMFQAAWFSVMLLPVFVYVPIILAFFIVHIGWIVPYRRVWIWIVRISVLGWLLDSMLLHMGVFDFSSGSVLPFWLLSLWTMFAFIFMTSVVEFRDRLGLLAVISFVSGPASYYGGVQLKAGASLADPVWQSLLFIGVAWCFFTPFILSLISKDPLLASPANVFSKTSKS